MKVFLTAALLVIVFAGAVAGSSFGQMNLVSDVPGLAAFTDPNIQDAWGMSFSATSPIWVSDRGTGLATLYSGTGVAASLVVTVPPGAAAGGPTGQVFAGPTTTFLLNGTSASFIFDTLAGTIDAWNAGAGTTASIVATTAGAQYEGLAIIGNTLYAANFVSGGGINVFNSSYFQQTLSPGAFTDPNLPAGYAPFNVQAINGNLYVEYAQLNPNPAIPVPNPGNGGYVDVYSPTGTLIQRLVSNGPLDAPWGITLAPASFGSFGGDLLIGNFGNGEINAFNPMTGAFLGTLTDEQGNPISISGLWALNFGNSSANPNGLYFTAGPAMGTEGLFGVIDVTPEPATWSLAALGILGICCARRKSRRGTLL
jgi:uncharacterized protein (TIGR03118 family)